MKYVGMGAIWLYQHTISIVVPSSCRFEPSCSAYTFTAIERYGLFKGTLMGIRRISRCHPYYHGNLFDPVP